MIREMVRYPLTPEQRELLRGFSDHALTTELCLRAHDEVGEEEADRLLEEAEVTYGSDTIEIDDDAMFSVGADGTWVRAWVLCSNAESDARDAAD